MSLLLVFPLLPPFFPPAVRIVPVKRPSAKKTIYMIAAGWVTVLGRIGGRENGTVPRLYIPISTNKSRTTIRKNVLKMSFAFMNFYSSIMIMNETFAVNLLVDDRSAHTEMP